MSTNKNTNKSKNDESNFDEYLAYEELRMIFVIAIETQNFENIEARIASWEKKYPLAEFQNPDIIRRIKAILNKDFLSRLLGDYLAAQVLHEQEKQKEAYDNLKEIINKAKKTKDFKTAQKEVRKWKDNLYSNGFNLYGFNRIYRARICTLLLIPSQELKNQEQATDELKRLKERGKSMDSTSYYEAISNWQNTYSIADFPDKLKKELNQITTEVFDSISQKRTSENAISEIESILSSDDVVSPVNSIASILSKYDYRRFSPEAVSTIEKLNMQAMSIQESNFSNGISNIDLSVISTISPTEANALTSLVDIINKTPHDMDTILNWIYVNRKISYSESARNEIIKQFSSVGYKIPEQSSYSIPEIDSRLLYTDSLKIDDLRKAVILNYLGILSQGKKLTIEGKTNLLEAHTISEEQSLSDTEHKPILFFEAFDTVVEQPEGEQEKQFDETGELITADEEKVHDIIDNPVVSYNLAANSIGANVTDEQVVEEAENVTVSSNPELVTINDNVNTENHKKKNTSSGDSGGGFSLSITDQNKLEQAQGLSTYIIVATPILEQVLEPRLEFAPKETEPVEIIKDL